MSFDNKKLLWKNREFYVFRRGYSKFGLNLVFKYKLDDIYTKRELEKFIDIEDEN